MKSRSKSASFKLFEFKIFEEIPDRVNQIDYFLWKQGVKAYWAKDYYASLKFFMQIFQKYKSMADLNSNIGILLFQLQLYNKSLQWLQSSYSIGSNYITILKNLLVYYVKRQQLDKATKLMTRHTFVTDTSFLQLRNYLKQINELNQMKQQLTDNKKQLTRAISHHRNFSYAQISIRKTNEQKQKSPTIPLGPIRAVNRIIQRHRSKRKECKTGLFQEQIIDQQVRQSNSFKQLLAQRSDWVKELRTSVQQNTEQMLVFNNNITKQGLLQIVQECNKSNKDSEFLQSLLKNLQFFTQFDRKKQIEIIDYSTTFIYEKDQEVNIIRDRIEYIYIIIRGTVIRKGFNKFTDDYMTQESYYDGQQFGSSHGNLLLATNRMLECLDQEIEVDQKFFITTSKTYLLGIAINDYDRILLNMRDNKTCKILGFFSKLPFFKGIEQILLIPLASNVQMFTYGYDEVIQQQGQYPKGLCAIYKGNCSVVDQTNYKIDHKRDNSVIVKKTGQRAQRPKSCNKSYLFRKDRILRYLLKPGDFFGARSLTDNKSSKSKRSIISIDTKVKVIVIDKQKLEILDKKVLQQIFFVIDSITDIDCPNDEYFKDVKKEIQTWQKFKYNYLGSLKRLTNYAS